MRPLVLSVLLVALAGRVQAEEAFRLSWRYVAGGGVLTRPAFDHRGLAYVLANDRYLYTVDPAGVERWRFRLDSRPAASPVITYDGTALAGTANGRLWAVGPNGRLRWSYTAAARPCLTPCLGADGSIYLPAGGTLVALSYRGEERWRYQLKADVAAAPVAGPDGTLYVAAADRRLLALDPSGQRRWEIALPGRVSAPAIAADGTLYVGASGVHCLSPEGALRWSYAIPAVTASPVLLPDGTVAVGAGNGKVYLLSTAGERLAEFTLRSQVRFAGIAAGADILYVTAESLFALRVGRGLELLGRFQAKQAMHYAALAPDGSLYAGAEDWILYRLEPAFGPAGGQGPDPGAVSAWPMAFHDFQHTGRAGGLADLDGPAALVLRELAQAEEEALKQRALDDIERHLAGERFLPVHLAVLEGVLGTLTAEGVSILRRTSGEPVRGFPRVRERACRLLGELASEGARQILLDSARLDEDLAVRLAALEGLGRIGLDGDGGLGYLLSREAARPQADERVVLAGLEALFRVLSSGPNAGQPADYRALAELASRGGSSRVRERAREILGELKRRLP